MKLELKNVRVTDYWFDIYTGNITFKVIKEEDKFLVTVAKENITDSKGVVYNLVEEIDEGWPNLSDKFKVDKITDEL